VKAPKKRARTDYIVAVRGYPQNELFAFPSKRARASFIAELRRRDPTLEFSTAEHTPDDDLH
jgi:hypothetical protein